MKFTYKDYRIYSENERGKPLAEVVFPKVDENTVCIEHTFVDDMLRGRGVASKLISATVDRCRAEGYKARLSCSYAKKWFGEHPEAGDVLRR
ncbi:MAG TPA: N-acetyltransferase [Clostridiales bacterium]|nr:N-acetyltransferase [Clostridiales bacterium]HBR07968.1 N-acetyltransferase [Clostridiales bacterium]